MVIGDPNASVEAKAWDSTIRSFGPGLLPTEGLMSMI